MEIVQLCTIIFSDEETPVGFREDYKELMKDVISLLKNKGLMVMGDNGDNSYETVVKVFENVED